MGVLQGAQIGCGCVSKCVAKRLDRCIAAYCGIGGYIFDRTEEHSSA